MKWQSIKSLLHSKHYIYGDRYLFAEPLEGVNNVRIRIPAQNEHHSERVNTSHNSPRKANKAHIVDLQRADKSRFSNICIYII